MFFLRNRAYRQKLAFCLALSALLVASLACNLPGRATQAPANATPIPVSTEALENLQENVQSAAATAQSGQPVTLTVTEQQLTSLVAFELQSQEQPIMTDPQVRLQNGQIIVTGNVTQQGISAPLNAVLTPSVDAQGKPHFEIVSAKVGPLPVPQSILDNLTEQMNRSFASELSAQTDNMIIEDIAIGDGVMTITGKTR